MKPNNAEYIKELNRKNILNIIRSTPSSRATLAEKTGLTRAAITFIINELIDKGMVYDREVVKSSIGRYPTILDINAKYGYVAGVLLERHCCCVCIADFKCNVIAETTIDSSQSPNVVMTIDHIAVAIDQLLENAGLTKDMLLAVGISSPGPVDYKSGVILNPPDFEMWHRIPVTDLLSRVLGVPAYIENISVALAIAEYRYGISNIFRSSLFIEAASGIGSAVIVNGKVFRGSAGFGVELGHSCLDVNGDKCTCGNHGCLEMYASLKSLEHIFADKWPGSWEKVMDGMESGDEDCTEIFNHEVKYLSAALANAANSYDLDGIILSRDFAHKSEKLISQLHEELTKRSIISQIHPVRIEIAKFTGTSNSSLRASAATAIEHCL